VSSPFSDDTRLPPEPLALLGELEPLGHAEPLKSPAHAPGVVPGRHLDGCRRPMDWTRG
jgi:hypothetical protein